MAQRNSSRGRKSAAVNYLCQARKLGIMIEQKEAELNALRQDAIGKDGKQMEEIVARYVDLEEKLRADLCELHSKRIEIMDTIHEVDDSLSMIVLHARWLDDVGLEEIAYKMGYSFPHIRRAYWKGMKAMQKIIAEKSEKDAKKP